MAERPLRIIVIGAGMSGILCGVRLREEGLGDLTIYEKAGRAGGTWRDNTYPGLSCDVPSHVYRYSFAPNPDWSHLFSPGAEILAYFEGVLAKYGLEDCIRFGEEVVRCTWQDGQDGQDGPDGEWLVETSSGRRDRADVVLSASGVLHHPNTPDIPGKGDFEGALFHSARWDHGVPLDGRRVGVIGTGSTAVQITCALVDRVSEFHLFQRTAQWVLPQENPAYSEEDKARFRREPRLMAHVYQQMSDSFANNFSNAVVDADSPVLEQIQQACRENLERVRDPELRARLTPDYRAACKRLVLADGFYEAIQQPSARLVTEAIERIEPAGIRTADGTLHELDVIVMATGFHAHQFMRPMQVIGRNGTDLSRVWAHGTPAYRSISIPDFPNFFMLIGPSSPIGNFSLVEIAEMQLDYILQLIAPLRAGECREVAARAEATRAFNDAMTKAAGNTVWVTGCNSWYLDERGIPAAWPWSMDRFRAEMKAPDFADYELVL